MLSSEMENIMVIELLSQNLGGGGDRPNRPRSAPAERSLTRWQFLRIYTNKVRGFVSK